MPKRTPLIRELFSSTIKVFGLALFILLLASFVSILSSRASLVSAAVPGTINYQARLLQSSGAIAPDGVYNVEFKLYSTSSGGSALWYEDYLVSSSTGITVKDGYLTANLGTQTAFPSTINWNQQLYLTMNIGGTGSTALANGGYTGGTNPWDGEMSPRIQLTAVPYAFEAASAAQATTLYSVSGAYSDTLQFATPTTGTNTITIPDGPNGSVVCLQSSTSCGFAPTTGSANYIQNQNAGVQATSNFIISGTGQANTSFLTPTLDSASGTLTIGGTTATTVAIGRVAGTTTITGVAASSIAFGAAFSVAGTSGNVVAGTYNTNTFNNAGQLTFGNAGAASIESSGAYALTLDTGGAGALNLGTGNATSVVIGGTSITTTNKGSLTTGNIAGTGVFTNNGATLDSTDALVNFTSNAAIGTGAATVDVYSSFSIPQTTANITLSVPTPTASTSYGRVIYISNIGTASFTIGTSIVLPGNTIHLLWSNTNGTASWQYVGDGGGSANYIQNQNAGVQATSNFIISGTGQANTSFLTPTLDSASGTLTIGGTTATTVAIGRVAGTTTITGVAASSIAFGAAFSVAGTSGNVVAGTYNTNTFNNAGQLTFGNAGAASINSNGANTLTLDTGGAAALNLGTVNANAVNIGTGTGIPTIQIGSITSGSGTQAIKIGNNATAGSTTNITIGNTIAGSVILQDLGITQTLTGSGTVPSDVIETSTNNAGAFQVDNALGFNVLSVNTSNGSTVLGNNSSTPLSGSLVFDNGNNSSPASVTLGVSSSSSTYSVTLPTSAPSATLCLESGPSGSTSQLQFNSCANNSPTITATGGSWSGTATSGTTVTGGTLSSMAPTSVGDLEVVTTSLPSTAGTVTAISGGGVTNWLKAGVTAATGSALRVEMWYGTVTATGTHALTLTHSTTLTSGTAEVNVTEFTAIGVSAGTTWGLDSVGGSTTGTATTTSTALSMYNLSPATSGELYYGFANDQSAGLGGAGNSCPNVPSTATWSCTASAGGQNNVAIYDLNAIAGTAGGYNGKMFLGTGSDNYTSYATLFVAYINSTAINNSTSTQQGNFNVEAPDSTSVTGVLEAGSGSADILDILNNTGAIADSFGSAGSLTVGIAGGTAVFTDNGATLDTTDALSNFSSGGSIGTAPTTVDIYSSFSIAQTTANETITVPNPTANTTYGRMIYISNIGSASFTLGSSIVLPGNTIHLVWSNTSGGASWQYVGDGGGSANYIQNQTAATQTANFVISGYGQANTKFLTPLLDVASAGTLTIGGSTATTISIGLTTASTQTIDIGTGIAGSTISTNIGDTVAGNTVLQANGITQTITGSSSTPTDIIKTTTNTAGAFQVQASGATILSVDTSGDQVTINGVTANTSGLQFSQLTSTSEASSNFSQLLGVNSTGQVGLSTAGVALTSPALAYWDGLNDPTTGSQSYPAATASGSAAFSSGNGEELTTATANTSGALNWNFSQVPFEESQFQYKAVQGTGADATWFYGYADGIPTTEFGTGITDGYIVYFSEYHGCAGITYGPFTDGDQCNNGGGTSDAGTSPLESVKMSDLADGNWHDVDIQINYNVITVRFDGAVILNYTDLYTRNTSNLNYGFGARNGSQADAHYIKGLLVTKLGSVASDFSIDNVDPLTNGLNWDNINERLGIDVASDPTTTLQVAGTTLLQGSLNAAALVTPAAPVVTNVGTTATTVYSYSVAAVAANGGVTPASLTGPTNTGDTTLSSAHYNLISWTAVPGAVSYNIYRIVDDRTSGASTGLLGNTVTNSAYTVTATSWKDTGALTASGSAPTTDSTAQFTVNGTTGSIADNGSATFEDTTASTTAFVIDNSSDIAELTADSNSGGNVYIGSSSSTNTTNTTFLVLNNLNDLINPNGYTGDPSGGLEGAMYYNTADNSFRCFENTVWRDCVGGLVSSNIAAGTAIVSSTTKTNFTGGAGSNQSYGVLAGDCQAGVTYLITASGVYGDTGTASLIMYLDEDGTTTSLLTGPTYTNATAETNAGWQFTGQMICDSTTAVEVQGTFIFGGNNATPTASAVFVIPNTATQTWTNALHTLYIGAKWGTSSATNTITMRQFIVQRLGP